MNKNTSHLAGEFLAAGELSRRGFQVSITLGNAKAVDIFVEANANLYKVEAKAIRAKANWPIKKDNVQKDVNYIFIYLGSEKAIKDNKSSEFYLLTGKEILSKNLVQQWGGGRQGITYQSVVNYRDKWSIFS